MLSSRLLGFTRGVCVRGPQAGLVLVLVRAQWLAHVRVDAWEPRFEMTHRRLVPASDAYASIWFQAEFAPLYRRMFVEAGLPVR